MGLRADRPPFGAAAPPFDLKASFRTHLSQHVGIGVRFLHSELGAGSAKGARVRMAP